jgi:hypothetical protein
MSDSNTNLVLGTRCVFDTKTGWSHAFCFFRTVGIPDDILQLNGRNIPFVSSITYLGVTFDRRVTWRHHGERTVAKALRTYVKDLLSTEKGRFSRNIKLRFPKL